MKDPQFLSDDEIASSPPGIPNPLEIPPAPAAPKFGSRRTFPTWKQESHRSCERPAPERSHMTAAHMDARSHTAYVGDASGEVSAHVLWPKLRVQQVLQTRGAAAVRCIVTADLLDPCGNGGLAVGCARGSIGYYHGGRTAICTHSLPFAVAALARHRAEDGQSAIAASDVGGTVLVFGLVGPLRRLRLQDFVAVASRLRHPAATAIESVRVLDAAGRRAGRRRSDEPRAQMLVAAGGPSLLRIRNDGSLACTLEAPGAVTALSVDASEDEDADDEVGLEQPRTRMPRVVAVAMPAMPAMSTAISSAQSTMWMRRLRMRVVTASGAGGSGLRSPHHAPRPPPSPPPPPPPPPLPPPSPPPRPPVPQAPATRRWSRLNAAQVTKSTSRLSAA